MPLFTCDLSAPAAPLHHVWSHTIGSNHALMALRADWQEQMRRVRKEIGVRYVRFHGILDDDMTVLLDEQDQQIYGFRNVDILFDFLLGIGMKPFVELSFMPSTLASGDKTVFNYRGNVTPPRDPAAWCTLIDLLVRHCIDRYGLDEVRTWFFEVWNEPNLDAFWTGGQAGYFDLYKITSKTLKAIDTQLRVGGPATANDEWIPDFLSFCRANDVACDFVSTHHYPTDALGKPGDDTEHQLALAASDVLLHRTAKACKEAEGMPVYYTEWSTTSNPFFDRHDDPYAAAFVAKNFLDVEQLVHAYSYWTFSDIFEENYFSSVPFHGGFGLLTVNNVAKPSYRAVQMLSRLGSVRLVVEGLHDTVRVAVARAGNGSVTALCTNHAFPEHAIEAQTVTLSFQEDPDPIAVSIERIDEDHANAKRSWKAMGSPMHPSVDQVRRLQAASELQADPLIWRRVDGHLTVEFDLSPHAVAAVTLVF
jgi:xylan 1,4-beta-xylosidase